MDPRRLLYLCNLIRPGCVTPEKKQREETEEREEGEVGEVGKGESGTERVYQRAASWQHTRQIQEPILFERGLRHVLGLLSFSVAYNLPVKGHASSAHASIYTSHTPHTHTHTHTLRKYTSD